MDLYYYHFLNYRKGRGELFGIGKGRGRVGRCGRKEVKGLWGRGRGGGFEVRGRGGEEVTIVGKERGVVG